MSTKTEGVLVHDVLRYEASALYCREDHTVLDGEVITIGEICKLNSDSKVVACAAAADEVQTITFDAAMTAGELTITIFTPDGEPITASVAWDTDWATTMAAWNTAITAAATAWYGAASVGAVMTGTATVPILTYSGVGFTSLAIPKLAEVDISGTTGPTQATVAQTTEGHSAGGDAEMVALEAASPDGADGTAVMLVRGPAVVNADQLTGPTGFKTAAVAALKALGIVGRDEATLSEET